MAASLELAFQTAYLCIVVVVVRGLRRTRQLRSNPLALAIAAIFLSAGIGHLLRTGQRAWPMGLWDAITAVLAVVCAV